MIGKIILIIIAIMVAIVIGVIFGIIYIYKKTTKNITNVIGSSNTKEFRDAFKNAISSEKEEYSKPKSISGMTNILLPKIQKEIPDFNIELLYSKVESGIKKYLSYKTSEKIDDLEKDNELVYISNILKTEIFNNKTNGVYEHFDNIKINNTAIREYKHVNGAVSIILNSSIQYKYDTNIKGKKVYSDINKQTRFITEFVYIYDEVAYNSDVYRYALNCPNCGATYKTLSAGNCDHCGTAIEPINMKNWYMVSCKEK